MKKLLFVLCFLVVPLVVSANINSNVRFGQTGPEVSNLQEVLIEKGYLKTKVTGFFGSLTLNAVKLYQSALGLPSTGFVGPMTRSRLNNGMLAQLIQTTTPTSLTYSVADDANQDGATMVSDSSTIWLGEGADSLSSYTGLKFNNVLVPKGAKIASATLEVYSPQLQWISLDMNIHGEKSGNSQSFSTSNISSRVLTQSKLTHSTNEKWLAYTWYKFGDLSPVIQEIVDAGDWQEGNSISLISKGSGAAYARKFISSIEGGSANAPRITITYTTSSASTSLPTAPSALSVAAQGSSQVNLSWTDNSGDETGFKIERKTGAGTYAEVATVNSNVVSYQNTGLSAETQYSYRVRAYNSAGNSAYSNEASATTDSVVVNSPTADIKVNNSDTGVSISSGTAVTLSWTSTNATNCTVSPLSVSGTSGSQSVTPTVNTTYALTCTNSVGASSDSVTVTVSTVPTAPSALSVAAQGSSQVNLSWTDNSGDETGFKIERKTGAGTYAEVATVNSNVVSYQNTGLSAETQYSYRVRAYNSAGNSAYSNEASATTGSIFANGKFTINQRVQTTAKIRVRLTPGTYGKSLGTQPLGALGSVLSGPINASGYNWWKIDYDFGVDGWSVENFLSALAINPPPPVDTTPPVISPVTISNLSSTTVTMTWTTNESAVSSLEYGLTNSYGSVVNSNGTLSHSVNLTGLNPATMYEFRITAKDLAGNVSNSSNQMFTTSASGGTSGGTTYPESMAMMAWKVGGKNPPNPQYDKCDDGSDVVVAHNQYYVIAYDGIKYPTWHPPVVTNPVSGVGKCYFGHEHGTDPQKYTYWSEIYNHFGKDLNGDGVISPIQIDASGKITQGDRAGIPFGVANEHMDQYYNQTGIDSIFVRHEDHVGHKIEIVNNESEMVGNTTHTMTQLSGTDGVNIPYYTIGSETYKPTGVSCAHLHKFHQGTNTGDAIRNNLHEVVFHSKCTSVDVNSINAPAYYPNNTVILTGMMTFGNPGGYKRFCGNDRTLLVCPDGKNPDGSCVVTDPLISKLPNAVYSDTLGRNMVDRSCLANIDSITGSFYFTPYEIWQGDLRISTPAGKELAEHGRQWDVLDPVRFVDPNSATGYSYNSEQCGIGGLLYRRTLLCENSTSNYVNVPWNSIASGFKGLKRTTYFGRNHVNNSGGPTTYWSDPLGGNAGTSQFFGGIKQYISSVNADIQNVQYRVQQLYGSNNFLNDRAIQRQFNDGAGTVHAPN